LPELALPLAPWLELAPWLALAPWPEGLAPPELAPWLEDAPWPLDWLSCFALSSAARVENETALKPAINR
jgi:hypothetical protein